MEMRSGTTLILEPSPPGYYGSLKNKRRHQQCNREPDCFWTDGRDICFQYRVFQIPKDIDLGWPCFKCVSKWRL